MVYQALYKELFPYATVTAIAARYGDQTLLTKNAPLEATIGKTLDALNEITTSLTALEEYLTLNTPQMEDGNNFGVTVQLAGNSSLTQTQGRFGFSTPSFSHCHVHPLCTSGRSQS